MKHDYTQLKKEVLKANLELVQRGLVIYTWGNVSQIDRINGVVAIKPRGIEYSDLDVDDISIVDLQGNIVQGALLPSVDLPIHLELYKAFEHIGGIAHTHSTYATIFAQSLSPIPVYGTTHADHFYGPVPVLEYLSKSEVEHEYEKHLGEQIVRYLIENNIDPQHMRGVLAGGHGPFTYGKSGDEAVEFSVILEEVAKMALHTHQFNHAKGPIPDYMLDTHYLRKYGKDAYFYQEK